MTSSGMLELWTRYAAGSVKVLLIFCAILSSGCALKDSMSSSYRITGEKPDGFSFSKNVILVADNQLNHLYGEPIWMRSQFVTQFVRVSIRPVQQDLFGQGILRWVLMIRVRHWRLGLSS